MATRKQTQHAAPKHRLPKDVTRLDPVNLNRNHVVVMLDFLGVATRHQPTDKGKKAELLRERIAADSLKAQVAYDVIVWNKLPEATQKITEEAEALKQHFYSAMNGLLEDERMDIMRTKVGEMAEALKASLETHGKKVLAEAAQNYRPIKITDKKGSRTVKGVLPAEFEQIVKLGSQRVPIMLVGPAGCGKTYIAGKLAEALGLTFYDQSCSEGVSESTFMGWLLPVGASGKFEYVSAPFIEAYEKGGVFLLDEIDAADPNLLTFLNKAIANDSFYLPQRHKNQLVKKHPDFVVIAAANTFGKGADAEYVGRNALDAATLDRFRAGMMHLDYSAEVEESLVHPDVLAWGRKVRETIYANKLRRIMSTRVMLDLTKMATNCEWVQEDWERAYFADWSKDELAMWERAKARDADAYAPASNY